MKNKLALKIGALIVVIFLIGLILFVTNSFVGNPISSAFAKKAIKDYVSLNYSYLDLEIEKTVYNFKDGTYMARAKSKTSIDTHFAIYYRDGQVKRDNYKTNVLGKYNTLMRLEAECSELVIPILSKVKGLENNRALVQIEKWEYEKVNEDIKIDMKFDKTVPINMKITLRADLSDNSLANIANILEDAHRILIENGYIFTSYGISSESNGVLVMISEVDPTDIESGELEKRLLHAQNLEDQDSQRIEKGDEKPEQVKRIRVFIKR